MKKSSGHIAASDSEVWHLLLAELCVVIIDNISNSLQ